IGSSSNFSPNVFSSNVIGSSAQPLRDAALSADVELVPLLWFRFCWATTCRGINVKGTRAENNRKTSAVVFIFLSGSEVLTQECRHAKLHLSRISWTWQSRGKLLIS